MLLNLIIDRQTAIGLRVCKRKKKSLCLALDNRNNNVVLLTKPPLVTSEEYVKQERKSKSEVEMDRKRDQEKWSENDEVGEKVCGKGGVSGGNLNRKSRAGTLCKDWWGICSKACRNEQR